MLVLVLLALAVFSERAFLAQISDKKPEALKQLTSFYRYATLRMLGKP